MSVKRIKKEEAILVVIDIQERLIPVMAEKDEVIASVKKLAAGFEAIGSPILVTQQYTKGLGDTIEEVKSAFTNFSHIEKSAFSAMGDETFVNALKDSGRKTVILCGIESHVCVLQSSLDMLEAGYDVFVVVDAVSSRHLVDEENAIKRMLFSGVVTTTSESVLFEMLDNDSKSDTFKAISKIVK